MSRRTLRDTSISPMLRSKRQRAWTSNSFPSPAQAAEFKVLNIAEQGDVVFTQRIDRFQMSGRQVELPVAGVFEVKDGRIAAWRH